MDSLQPFINRVNKITTEHGKFTTYLGGERFDTVHLAFDYEDKHCALSFSRNVYDMSPPMTLDEAQRLAFNSAGNIFAFVEAAHGIEEGVDGLPANIREEYEQSHRRFEETAHKVARYLIATYQRHDKGVRIQRIADSLDTEAKQLLHAAATERHFEIPLMDVPARWEDLPSLFEHIGDKNLSPFLRKLQRWVEFEKQGLITVSNFWGGKMAMMTSEGMWVAECSGFTPVRAEYTPPDNGITESANE